MIAAHFTFDECIAYRFDYRTGGEAERAGLFDKFGVKSLYWGESATEQEYVSNKLIVEPEDYKGLNFRGVGWTGYCMAEPEFCASGIVIPGADIYSALQTGVIDACEYANVFSNINAALHEVCKYGGFPGMHQFSQTQSQLINIKKWNMLPPDMHKILEVICHAKVLRNNAYNWIQCAYAMDELEANGNIMVRESPRCQRTWKEVSWRIADRMAEKSERFKIEWDREVNFINNIRPYLTIQTPMMGKKMTTVGIFKWSELKAALR